MISKAGPTSDYPCQKALWTIWMTLPARWKQIYTSSHQWTARIFMKPVPDAATQTSKTFKKPVKLKVNRQQMQFVSKWYHVFSGYATLWCAIVPKFACLCKLSRNYIYNIYIYIQIHLCLFLSRRTLTSNFRGHWPCQRARITGHVSLSMTNGEAQLMTAGKNIGFTMWLFFT